MRGRVDASPVVVEADVAGRRLPVAVVADAAGRVAALDVATGAPAWEFDAGGGFDAGAAVADGRVVIASGKGTLWCFATPR
jgi:outer membrane protein assembly factor BamB